MGDGRIRPLLLKGSTPDPVIPLEKFRNAPPKVTPRGYNGDIIPTDKLPWSTAPIMRVN